MIGFIVVLGLAYLALLVFLYQTTGLIEKERQSWRAERSELLNRIQAPERISWPADGRPAPLHVVPDDEGEIALVGRVVDVPRGDDE